MLPLRESLHHFVGTPVVEVVASCPEQSNQGHFKTFECQQNIAGPRAAVTGGQSTESYNLVRAQNTGSNRVTTYQQTGVVGETTFSQTDPRLKLIENGLQELCWISCELWGDGKQRAAPAAGGKNVLASLVVSPARDKQEVATRLSQAREDPVAATRSMNQAVDNQSEATSLMSQATDDSEDSDDVNPGWGDTVWDALLCPFCAIFQILACCWTGLTDCFLAAVNFMLDYLPVLWSTIFLSKNDRERVKIYQNRDQVDQKEPFKV